MPNALKLDSQVAVSCPAMVLGSSALEEPSALGHDLASQPHLLNFFLGRSNASQADPKLTILAEDDLELLILHFSNAGITGVRHHAQHFWDQRSNPGPPACSVSMLSAELRKYSQPIHGSFFPSPGAL